MSRIGLPDPIDVEALLRTAAFQLLLQTAEGASLTQLAERTGISVDKVSELIAQLARTGRIRINSVGNVVGSAGLSVVTDRHEIDLDGRRFWTWCAYNIFGIFGALGANGRALSLQARPTAPP